MDKIIGLLVDGIAEVVDIFQSQIELSPNVGSDDSSKYIQGVYSKNGELLILVDVDKVLSVKKWEEMEA